MNRVKTEVKSPEEIVFKLEAEFTLREWQKISKALDQKWIYPMSDLGEAIRDCTRQAEKVFLPNNDTNNINQNR